MDALRSDHLVGIPLEFRNCLSVEALMPKFTFSGIDPVALAMANLFNWATTTPHDSENKDDLE